MNNKRNDARMNTTIALIICTAAAAVGFIFGWAIAYPRARAVGWLEHREEVERIKALRRDQRGRFVAVTGKPINGQGIQEGAR